MVFVPSENVYGQEGLSVLQPKAMTKTFHLVAALRLIAS